MFEEEKAHQPRKPLAWVGHFLSLDKIELVNVKALWSKFLRTQKKWMQLELDSYWNGSSLLRSFCLSDKYVWVNFKTFVISAQNAWTSLVIHDPGCGLFLRLKKEGCHRGGVGWHPSGLLNWWRGFYLGTWLIQYLFVYLWDTFITYLV